jgi:hypothetical protein
VEIDSRSPLVSSTPMVCIAGGALGSVFTNAKLTGLASAEPLPPRAERVLV